MQNGLVTKEKNAQQLNPSNSNVRFQLYFIVDAFTQFCCIRQRSHRASAQRGIQHIEARIACTTSLPILYADHQAKGRRTKRLTYIWDHDEGTS